MPGFHLIMVSEIIIIHIITLPGKNMNIIDQLSSQKGDRTQESNQLAAEKCLANPGLLSDIAQGLQSRDKNLAGDCAEVMTLAAASAPEKVFPFAIELLPLLDHKATRVRWEAAHALALVADLVPEIVNQHLGKLHQQFKSDTSIIVRDYLMDVAARYAAKSPDAATRAWPMLQDALVLWEGRHAGHAVPGLEAVAAHHPGHINEIKSLCGPLLEHHKAVIRKSITSLLKKLESLKGA